MPRKDPMTGCMVMTRQELFQDEADEKGIPWYEVQNQMFDEIDADSKRIAQAMKDDGGAEDKLIVLSLDEWECGEDWWIVSAEIVNVEMDQGFGGDTTTIEGKAFCSDGKFRDVTVEEVDIPSTYWEPPDYFVNWTVDGVKYDG